MEKTWSRFLNESGLCQEDPLTGNRPCDNGCLCDKCHTEEVRRQYEAWKAAPEGLGKKEKIKALETHFGVKAKYMGTPSFAYQLQAGEKVFTITREGNIENARGNQVELDSIISRSTPERIEATDNNTDPDIDGVEITIPLTGHTGVSLKNMVNMIYSKQSLIQKSLGLEGKIVDDELVTILGEKKPDSAEDFKALLPETGNDKTSVITFDFEKERITFKFNNLSEDQIKACSKMLVLIDQTAKTLRNASSKSIETDNEKYAFRTWLIRLGMIGGEYKAARKTLLANLEGNGAFRKVE